MKRFAGYLLIGLIVLFLLTGARTFFIVITPFIAGGLRLLMVLAVVAGIGYIVYKVFPLLTSNKKGSNNSGHSKDNKKE